jgi:hypothetical protein
MTDLRSWFNCWNFSCSYAVCLRNEGERGSLVLVCVSFHCFVSKIIVHNWIKIGTYGKCVHNFDREKSVTVTHCSMRHRRQQTAGHNY